MTRHVRRGPPKVYVWVNPLQTPRGIEIDVSVNVVAFQASKSLTDPTGRFSLTLLPRQAEGSALANIKQLDEFYRSLHPNAVVSIGFEEKGGIMLGLVDRVARTRQLAGPMASQGIQITGRDLGKLFVNDSIIKANTSVTEFPDYITKIRAALGDSPILYDLVSPWATREAIAASGVREPSPENTPKGAEPPNGPVFQGGSIEDIVKFILARTPAMNVPILSQLGAENPAAYIRDNSAYTVTPLDQDQVWKDSIKDYQGTVWNFLWSALDQDLYEMWLDTVPDDSQPTYTRPVLVIRPKPFDEPGLEFAPVEEDLRLSWKDLTTLLDNQTHHEIALDEVLQESLGFDDSQAFSYYVVTSQHDLLGNTQGATLGLSFPLVDLWGAKRFGLKAYNCRLVNAGADITLAREDQEEFGAQVRTRVQEVRNRLFNWYRLNPYFETGSMTIVGRDRIRVGDPVFRPDLPAPIGGELGMRYYVTGVSWSWSYGDQYTTTLQVSRGHNDAMIEQIKQRITLEGASQTPPNPKNYATV